MAVIFYHMFTVTFQGFDQEKVAAFFIWRVLDFKQAEFQLVCSPALPPSRLYPSHLGTGHAYSLIICGWGPICYGALQALEA